MKKRKKLCIMLSILLLIDCLCINNISYAKGKKITKNYFKNDLNAKSIYISSDVTKIEDGAFSKLKLLQNITVDKNNKYYSSYDGCLYNKDFTTLICIPRNKGQALIKSTIKNCTQHSLDGLSKERKANFKKEFGFGPKKSKSNKSSTKKENKNNKDTSTKNSDDNNTSSKIKKIKRNASDEEYFKQWVKKGVVCNKKATVFDYTGTERSYIVVPEGVTDIQSFANLFLEGQYIPLRIPNYEITSIDLPSTYATNYTMTFSNLFDDLLFDDLHKYYNNVDDVDIKGYYSLFYQCPNLKKVTGGSDFCYGTGSEVICAGKVIWSANKLIEQTDLREYK